MKIIFYKAEHGTFADKVISLFTRSKYSHCEILFSDGVCASSSPRDGGIRLKSIQIGDHWDVFELIGRYDEDAIKYWFMTNLGDSYDWLGAFGSVLSLDLTSEDKKFCSYSCAIVLGLDPIVSPGGLFRKLKRQCLI